jgi:indolepyruvate ferredoxin oxidoreductase alpha subunit
MLDAVEGFIRRPPPAVLPAAIRAPNVDRTPIPDLTKTVPIRPPGFCTGCPERPIFAAMKLVERELGQTPDRRRHRLPPVRDPAPV